jgi:hypothetical protein
VSRLRIRSTSDQLPAIEYVPCVHALINGMVVTAATSVMASTHSSMRSFAESDNICPMGRDLATAAMDCCSLDRDFGGQRVS